jgi:predicted Fe-Mo cluster-binding NifX family protein
MTRVALPTWDGRVSPVFDVARHLLVVDLDGARELGRRFRPLPASEPPARVQVLLDLEVDVLVCGAISRGIEDALTAAGVKVMSGVRGDAESVVLAFSVGNLEDDATLHLPGSWPRAEARPVRARAGHADRPRHGTGRTGASTQGRR